MLGTNKHHCKHTETDCPFLLLHRISNGQFGYHDNTKSAAFT